MVTIGAARLQQVRDFGSQPMNSRVFCGEPGQGHAESDPCLEIRRTLPPRGVTRTVSAFNGPALGNSTQQSQVQAVIDWFGPSISAPKMRSDVLPARARRGMTYRIFPNQGFG